MQLTTLIILSITLTPCLNQKLTPNAVTTLLQGILSPKSTGHVMHMLSAANKKRTLQNVPKTINRRFVIAENLPKTDAQNKMTYLVQRPSEKCMKKNAMIQNPMQVLQNGNQMVLPKNMIIQRRPETVLPKNVVIQNGEVTLPRNVIVRANEMNGGEISMPRNVIVRKNEMNGGEISMPRNVIVRNNEMPRRMVVQNDFGVNVPQMTTPKIVQQNVLRTQPTEYLKVPQQKVLIHSENPFLPAASPISPLTALSKTGLPSAMPRSRGQFLRKIPIPPPTI